METIKQEHIVLICGFRGSGKTYAQNEILKKTPRFFAWDPMHDIQVSRSLVTDDLSQAYEWLRKKSPRIIYRPKKINIKEFDWICEKIYLVGNYVFAVDEADLVMPNNQITENAKHLVDLGRHQKVGMIVTTRRIAMLDKTPASQAFHVLAFHTMLPNDVKYLRQIIGPMADSLPAIKGHKFIYFCEGRTYEHLPL